MSSALLKKINFILKNPAITSDAAIEEIKFLLASEEKNQSAIQPTELAAELISRKAEQLKNPFLNENIYTTGFEAFDRNFKGFYPGELIVVGGQNGSKYNQISIANVILVKNRIVSLYYYKNYYSQASIDSAKTINDKIALQFSNSNPAEKEDN